MPRSSYISTPLPVKSAQVPGHLENLSEAMKRFECYSIASTGLADYSKRAQR